MKTILTTLLISLMTFVTFVSPAHARSQGEQKQTFGDYEVHYIGLNSTFLNPDTAEAYGIVRSKSLGYLSISILKKQADGSLPTAIDGSISGNLRNLIGQKRNIEFQEIKEANAVYYISTFRFDDEDLYYVTLKVSPSDTSQEFTVKFNQKFYEE